MKTKETKKEYPMLSLRITPEQRSDLRRRSVENGLSIPDYARAVLFPFELPDDK